MPITTTRKYTFDSDFYEEIKQSGIYQKLIEKLWKIRVMIHYGWIPPISGLDQWWNELEEDDLFELGIDEDRYYEFEWGQLIIPNHKPYNYQDKKDVILKLDNINIPNYEEAQCFLFDSFSWDNQEPNSCIFLSKDANMNQGIIAQLAYYPTTGRFAGEPVLTLKENNIYINE